MNRGHRCSSLLFMSLMATCWTLPVAHSSDALVNITVIHSFNESIEILLDCATALLDVMHSNVLINFNTISLETQDDLTGAALFGVGQLLQNNPHVEAIVGPSRSGDVLLLHPRAVSMEIPHIAPTASDPVFEANDRFPQLIRMKQAYQHQASTFIICAQHERGHSIIDETCLHSANRARFR